MDTVHFLGRLSGYLLAMEEVNMDERYQLYYHFQEIPYEGNVESSIHAYYQNYVDRISLMGNHPRVLQEVCTHWFYEPLSPEDADYPFSKSDSRVSRFIDLLAEFFGTNPLTIFELELPFGHFGSYSEHYAFFSNGKLFLLHLTMV